MDELALSGLVYYFLHPFATLLTSNYLVQVDHDHRLRHGYYIDNGTFHIIYDP
jgi:hypothetical protein